MSLGISVYFGLDSNLEENLKLIKKANILGYKKIFTSLHIPEANYQKLKNEIREVFAFANKCNMEIISDISPNTFKFLNLKDKDLEGLSKIGVNIIRVDFGYTEKEIAKMSKNNLKIKLVLNASTVTEEFFKKLDNYNPNYYNIQALHNFYPRKNTGISEEFLLKQNEILFKKGIEVSAFIPSNNKKRGPLKEGLPTLEVHRNEVVKRAANHLFALGLKNVFIGDLIPSDEELVDLSNLREEGVELKIHTKTNDPLVLKLLREVYSSRIDEAKDAIRAVESREILNGEKIKAFNTVEKSYGDVIIDNEEYGRYMGELQILTTNQKSDKRSNVVAYVMKEDHYLLKYIKNGKKFYFNIVGKGK